MAEAQDEKQKDREDRRKTLNNLDQEVPHHCCCSSVVMRAL